MEGLASRLDLMKEAQQTLALLTALLKGQLSTDASSPLDYMVKGLFISYKKSAP